MTAKIPIGLCLTSSLVSVLLAVPALAQVDQAPDDQMVDEIIVTAQGREQRLKDVPVNEDRADDDAGDRKMGRSFDGLQHWKYVHRSRGGASVGRIRRVGHRAGGAGAG